MKIISIIIKNFKVVSRNWSYFVVLVLCPVLLVLAAGAMLNSSDISNLKVGTTGDLSLSNSLEIENDIEYTSLSDCLRGLTEKEIGVCVNSYTDEIKGTQFEVYFDNTERRVESYAKQLILGKVSTMQSQIIEQAGVLVYSEVNSIFNSMNNAESELNQAYLELNLLENDLIDYQMKLRNARVDFDNMYVTLKSLQTDINNLDIDAVALRGDIAEFKRSKSELEARLNSIRPQLDYLTLQQLDSALIELDRVEADLDKVDKMLGIYQSLESNLSSIILKLDEMRILLNGVDSDLEKNIQSTKNTKIKIQSFLRELSEAKTRLSAFEDNLGLQGYGLVFKEVYEIGDDLVLIAFPLLIAIIISFTSIILSNLFISQQINHQSFLRDLISPTRDISFLVANYFVTLFFVFLQAVFLFIVGYYWFDINVLNNLGQSAFLILLVSSIFVIMGMSIGYLIKSQYLSMLISIFFVLLFFIFSDVLTPSSLTGPVVGFFMKLNPFGLMSNGLTDLIILNKQIPLDSFMFYEIGFILSTLIVIYYISKKICNYKSRF